MYKHTYIYMHRTFIGHTTGQIDIYQPEGPFKQLPFPNIGACAVGVTAFTPGVKRNRQELTTNKSSVSPQEKTWDANHHHWGMMCVYNVDISSLKFAKWSNLEIKRWIFIYSHQQTQKTCGRLRMFLVQDQNFILEDYNPIWNDSIEFWGEFFSHVFPSKIPGDQIAPLGFARHNLYFCEINELGGSINRGSPK